MKIRKRIIVLAFLAVAFISAMAQKQQFDYTIYGVVEDSTTHEGEPYATLSIYRKGHEEKAVQMAVTDANGKFKVTSKGEGDYVLEVKSVSRTPLRRFFTVSKQSRSQNLGTLLVSDIRLNYEKYFYRNSGVALPSERDKIVVEVMTRF